VFSFTYLIKQSTNNSEKHAEYPSMIVTLIIIYVNYTLSKLNIFTDIFLAGSVFLSSWLTLLSKTLES